VSPLREFKVRFSGLLRYTCFLHVIEKEIFLNFSSKIMAKQAVKGVLDFWLYKEKCSFC
jgi:hypothetical protein